MAVFSAGCLRMLLLLTAVVAATAAPSGHPTKQSSLPPVFCRDRSCVGAEPNMLNVHIVPHSHDDVGWLKTVDQYYYGGNTRTQRAGVQYIFETVTDELARDPKKKFVQVETAFFQRWYNNIGLGRQLTVKRLVRTGQLQIIGGAWSMNDEAATNYQSIVDQFTWGLRFLNDTFGFCGNPRTVWQIDPFGHSRGFATLLSQMGIDGLFLGRVDWQDKANRLQKRTPEMVWKTSPNLGKTADLFTGVLYNRYSAPPGFCFDDQCRDEPINDDVESPDYNVKSKVDDFIKYVQKQASNYSGSHIMLTMGSDFNYQSASTWYTNLDRLIHFVNQRKANGSKVNAFYSTPSCYIVELNKTNSVWTTKEDDFFPYSSDPHAFWAGYFTSRPTHKYMERLGNNFLQVSKQLSALAVLKPEDKADISPLKEAMGIVQHHDAITGTEKQHVANDYGRLLTKALHRAADATQKALQKLTNKAPKESTSGDKATPPQFQTCLTLNISQCETTETKKKFVVTVYNPLAQKENVTVRVPVPKGAYSVRDPQGQKQKTQLVPIPEAVIKIPGRVSSATLELLFSAENLPPLGFRSYYVEKTGDALPDGISIEPVNAFKIGFEKGASVEVDSETGLLKTFTKDGVALEVKQNFFNYIGFKGNNQGSENRASGAYIFRPNGSETAINTKATVKVYKGELVQEIHQVYSDWVTQVIRANPNDQTVEFVWQIGPIPIEDKKGREIISRYETPLQSQGIFYTDSNGRELIERKRDFRPTYTVDLKEKIAGNYYPVTSRISLRDAGKKQTFGVLVDRAEGGSSLKDGQIELMIHRRLLHDDALGVGEALNETAFGAGLVARGSHVLFAGDEAPAGKPTLSAQARLLALRLLLKPWLFFSDATSVTFEDWQKNYVMEWFGINNPLPDNLHLMTLEPWRKEELLVRLEHILERNEDSELSKPVVTSLKALLKPYNVHTANETTLAANLWFNQTQRINWKTGPKDVTGEEPSEGYELDIQKVTLNPMEIRTFVLNVTAN